MTVTVDAVLGCDRRRDRPRARPLARRARLRAARWRWAARRPRRPAPADLLVLPELRLPDGGRRPRGRPGLPGAERVRVELVDHYAGERISDGRPAGPHLPEAFPDQADGELHELAPQVPPEGVRRAPGAGPAGRAARRWATTRRSPCAWATGRRPTGASPASGRSTCAAAATWAWTSDPDALVFTDAAGRAARRRRARPIPAPGALGADQPAVEHGVLHRPARRALRRRAWGEGGSGRRWRHEGRPAPAYDAELSTRERPAARDHRAPRT